MLLSHVAVGTLWKYLPINVGVEANVLLASVSHDFVHEWTVCDILPQTLSFNSPQHLWRTMAMPWPPPMQAEPTAYLPPRRLSEAKPIIPSCFFWQHLSYLYDCRHYKWPAYLSSWARWAVMRVPEAPRGCPRAMAPPLTLLFSGSSPRALATDRYWGAKASFTCAK